MKMSEAQLNMNHQDMIYQKSKWLTQEEYSKNWYASKEEDAFILLKEALADYEKNRDAQMPDEKWHTSGIILHLAYHLANANWHLLEFAKREEGGEQE